MPLNERGENWDRNRNAFKFASSTQNHLRLSEDTTALSDWHDSRWMPRLSFSILWSWTRSYAYFVPGTPRPSPAMGATPLRIPSGSQVGSAWPRDGILRQCISILVITQLGATLLYRVFSAFSYYYIFDRRLEYHPRFLKNQVRQEIISSMSAVPWINILTLPIFLAEVRGKSLLYTDVEDYGLGLDGDIDAPVHDLERFRNLLDPPTGASSKRVQVHP